ncbi:MAG: hypothetical protein A2Y12_03535 [Planctomycetes bacterium GWF2_42_9]|nr:MAG: hypothetical protein A2Y12_03535 [Planctomycetes bacterium GWF2_42_9]
MIVRFFEGFDRHCLVYFFLIGFALGLNGPEEGSAFYCGAVMTFVGGLAWYTLKAIFITGSTVRNWDKTNPGEPMFRAGGLTEYDQDYAEAVGKAAAEAISRQNNDGK